MTSISPPIELIISWILRATCVLQIMTVMKVTVNQGLARFPCRENPTWGINALIVAFYRQPNIITW